MRLLVLMRGVPGSGKSTFLKKNGLEDYTIEVDDVRKLYSVANQVMNDDGEVVYDGVFSIEQKVWDFVNDAVETRMQHAMTTIVDATFLFKRGATKAFNKFKKLADKYGYRVVVATINPQLELEDLIERDAQRTGVDRVGAEVVTKYYERLHDEAFKVSKSLNPVTINTEENASDFLRLFDWKPFEFDKYVDIQVIGDVHGSYTALTEALGDIDDKRLYVFVGDWFDRGIENELVAQWLIDNYTRSNFVFLLGNHDVNFLNYFSHYKEDDFSDDKLYKVAKTSANTIKNLEAEGLLLPLKDVFQHFQPLLHGWFNGNKIIFTHAGLTGREQMDTSLFSKFNLLNEDIVVRGVGGYTTDIDEMWEASGESAYQFHGHRNMLRHGVKDFEFSYNLEQAVEFGGKLGSVTIHKKGDLELRVEDVSVKNNVHHPYYVPYDERSLPWNVMEQLKNHWGIESKSIGYGISAYNFSEEVFKKGKWDKLTTTARGLFVDATGHIVARGFNKFPNIGESEESSYEAILNRIEKNPGAKWEVSTKHNGFLAIVSWSEQMNDVLITSKGGGKKFSELATDVLESAVMPDYSSWFKEHPEISIMLEIIEPDVDPHVIKYDKPSVYVLQAVTNTLEPEYRPDLAEDFYNLYKFDNLYLTERQVISAEDVLPMIELAYESHLEGMVFREMDTNFMVKVKSAYYLGIKEFRGMMKFAIGREGWTEKFKRSLPSRFFYQEPLENAINNLMDYQSVDGINPYDLIYWDSSWSEKKGDYVRYPNIPKTVEQLGLSTALKVEIARSLRSGKGIEYSLNRAEKHRRERFGKQYKA